MIKNKKVLAIIPARAGSKGLPNKNIKLFCGKPLIAWTIKEAKKSKYIDNLVLSTNSKKIADKASEYGANVPFLRPDEISKDESSSIDVLIHAVEFFKEVNRNFDYVILLEPTSPLRMVEDIDGALEMLDKNSDAQSIVSFARVENQHPSFLYEIDNGFIKAISGNYTNALRRQDIKGDFFYPEGTIYIINVNYLMETRKIYSGRTIPWIVSKEKSIEIDDIYDFIQAEAIMKFKIKNEL